jgi:hypothetical protein
MRTGIGTPSSQKSPYFMITPSVDHFETLRNSRHTPSARSAALLPPAAKSPIATAAEDHEKDDYYEK